jgi:hypothetical protein
MSRPTKKGDTVELRECPFCGSPCRVETFGPTPIIHDPVSLWVCSNHPRFGGDCQHDLAYFDAEAWNTRSSPEVVTVAPDVRLALEVGLEWAIEGANSRKQKDAVFDNAMRDIKRIEDALSKLSPLVQGDR